jgi:hypothetical protein
MFCKSRGTGLFLWRGVDLKPIMGDGPHLIDEVLKIKGLYDIAVGGIAKTFFHIHSIA